MSAALGLGHLVRAGARAVSHYTGMVLGLFVVQVVVSWSAGFVAIRLLADAFATRPMFDDAVDGDLVALIELVRDSSPVPAATAWVLFGAVLAWLVAGWFLTGGVLAVFVEQPHGRGDTGRCFGAGGASHFLVFARLGVVSFLLHLPVLVVLMLGIEWAMGALEVALTLREVAIAVAVAVVPAALMRLVLVTAIDYARIELVLRRPTHASLGALQAALRGLRFAVRQPLALVHVLLYALFFVAVTVSFAGVAYDHAMLGGSGALALLALRSGVALLRCAASVGVTAGQLELGATRLPPPRPVVVDPG